MFLKKTDLVKYLLVLPITYGMGCSEIHRCKVSDNMLVKIDTTKPYLVKGKGYISKAISNHAFNDSTMINFNIYDRITGLLISQGAIILNDKTFIPFKNGHVSIKLKTDLWSFGISSTNLPFVVNKLRLKKNTEIEFNAYLSSLLQF